MEDKQRLTPEREAEIRRMAEGATYTNASKPFDAMVEVLAELDAVRAERDQAVSDRGGAYFDGVFASRSSVKLDEQPDRLGALEARVATLDEQLGNVADRILTLEAGMGAPDFVAEDNEWAERLEGRVAALENPKVVGPWTETGNGWACRDTRKPGEIVAWVRDSTSGDPNVVRGWLWQAAGGLIGHATSDSEALFAAEAAMRAEGWAIVGDGVQARAEPKASLRTVLEGAGWREHRDLVAATADPSDPRVVDAERMQAQLVAVGQAEKRAGPWRDVGQWWREAAERRGLVARVWQGEWGAPPDEDTGEPWAWAVLANAVSGVQLGACATLDEAKAAADAALRAAGWALEGDEPRYTVFAGNRATGEVGTQIGHSNLTAAESAYTLRVRALVAGPWVPVHEHSSTIARARGGGFIVATVSVPLEDATDERHRTAFRWRIQGLGPMDEPMGFEPTREAAQAAADTWLREHGWTLEGE